jgi:hypothetical protein
VTSYKFNVSNVKINLKLKLETMDNYSVNLITETLSWLGFFTAVFLSFYFYLRFRNKERMALIEKGIDVSEIYKSRDITFKFPWLRLGILVLAIGLGVGFGYLFAIQPPPPFNNQTTYNDGPVILTFSILVFGGLGIIIGNIIERSGKKKNG